jgi:hypothetical protein
VAICKDMDFPESFQDYGRYGAQILAVPAWDFGGDGRLHSRMAVLRGVENGFSIARVANRGVVTVYDAYGRILAERSSSGVAGALLVQNVSLGPFRVPQKLLSSFSNVEATPGDAFIVILDCKAARGERCLHLSEGKQTKCVVFSEMRHALRSRHKIVKPEK